MSECRYEVVEVTDEKIVLNDLSNQVFSRSITNDAECLVAELFEKYGDLRIFYYDTMGMLTELDHENGKFTKFLFASG